MTYGRFSYPTVDIHSSGVLRSTRLRRKGYYQYEIKPNEEITEIYFPYDVVTSTIQELSDGDAVERD